MSLVHSLDLSPKDSLCEKGLMMFRAQYENVFVKSGIVHAYLFCMLLALVLQITGFWILMILAGTVGGLFTKRLPHAFIAGFLGVAVAWSILFLIQNTFAQAYVVAEFFATLIGMPEAGRWIVSLSILLGGFLGGSGGLVGRAMVELAEEFTSKKKPTETAADVADHRHT
nr:MAG: hypothetical protein AM324_07255 [Candidatus Thorarchaeota archaeon SMTZ1-83]